MQRVRAGRVEEIRPGVRALSNLVDLRQPVSWVEQDAMGFDPSNSYLITGTREALLIDTGFHAHAGSLVEQIRGCVDPAMPLSVALTRVEPDCLGGLIEIAEQFNLVRVSSQSNVVPFEYLGPFSGRFPGVEIVNGLHPGDTVPAGPGRSLIVVEPAVRTLPTLWYVDTESGTLFCSDFFGEDRLRGAGDWQPHPVDLHTARRHLLTKFDWIAIADTSAAVVRLDRVFETYHLHALAPGHGLWTMGEIDVRERYRMVREALAPAPALKS